MSLVEAAVNKGLRVALVDKDALGGTCLNRGCIPSKMMVYPADVVQEARRAASLGVEMGAGGIDLPAIMARVRASIAHDRRQMEESIGGIKDLSYYPSRGEFVGDYTMSVGGETIEARNIFLVSGARPDIPPIRGLDGVDYLTYRNVFDLEAVPRSMVVAGGGYIACELAHVFDTAGVDLTIVSRSPQLLRGEEPEVGELLTKSLGARMGVMTSTTVEAVRQTGAVKEVTVRGADGAEKTLEAEALLVAAGLRGNADTLRVERTGVAADQRGYIKVNEFSETSKPRIWALGDAIGRAMFKHAANREAELVWHAFDHGHRRGIDFDKVPYAVFSWPQVAGVGITEAEAAARGLRCLVGVYAYADTAYGEAMGERDGFVKLVVEDETNRILGCRIVGPHASMLIQEVVTAMSAGDGSVYPLIDALHIHPALTEVVQRSVWRLQRPDHADGLA